MRKPRDFDSELKALNARAKSLKDRKVKQLGELVVATGADVLDLDILAGALLATTLEKSEERKEADRQRGVAFFQRSKPDQGRGNAVSNITSHPQAIGAQEPLELRSGKD